MLSRRELITAGVAGGIVPVPAPATAEPLEQAQPADKEGQRDIARSIKDVESVLHKTFQSASLAYGVVSKLRADMETFLRANQKFPDYVEVGVAVFLEIYDWHIKNRQPLNVTRIADGRYAMQFMFSTLILRPEQDRLFVGVPFDRG